MRRLSICCLAGAATAARGAFRSHSTSSLTTIPVSFEENTGAFEEEEGGGDRSASSSSLLPPTPPRPFELLHVPGSRTFELAAQITETARQVVVRCIVPHRAIQPFPEERRSISPYRERDHGSSAHSAASVSEKRVDRLYRRRRKVAMPTYASDELPLYYTAFVSEPQQQATSATETPLSHPPCCLEVSLASLKGFMSVEGVVVHKGRLRESLVQALPFREPSELYRGPLLHKRHLGDYVLGLRRRVSQLQPYRQHEADWMDETVNPLVSPHDKFGHSPVHVAPPRLTDAIVEVLRCNLVDDDLAEFVYSYAWYVQKQSNAAWRRGVTEALALDRQRKL